MSSRQYSSIKKGTKKIKVSGLMPAIWRLKIRANIINWERNIDFLYLFKTKGTTIADIIKTTSTINSISPNGYVCFKNNDIKLKG